MSKPKAKAKFQATEENMQAIVDCLYPEGMDTPALSKTVVELADDTGISAINVRTIITGLRKAGVPIVLPGGSRYAAFARSLGFEAPPSSAPAPGAAN